MKKYSFFLPLFLMVIVVGLDGCKSGDAVEPFTNSTLPSNYTNQGTITVKSTKLKICVWDYSAIDGDVIDLFVNGRKMFSKLAIDENKQCIEVTLPDGENWIGVSAIEEGYNPPASPRVEISDGVRTQGFDILAYINKPGGYKIKVVL